MNVVALTFRKSSRTYFRFHVYWMFYSRKITLRTREKNVLITPSYGLRVSRRDRYDYLSVWSRGTEFKSEKLCVRFTGFEKKNLQIMNMYKFGNSLGETRPVGWQQSAGHDGGRPVFRANDDDGVILSWSADRRDE